MTTFEHEFEVEATVEAVWNRILDAQPAEPVEGRWWVPGFDSAGEEVALGAPTRLTVRKSSMPCEGTLIDFTFEHIASGTRIRVVQSGFDEAWVESAGESFWAVANHIRYDVELFFRRGVVGGRHGRPFTWFGWLARPTSEGLEITHVMDDTYAARAGVAPGDVLLTVGGAPVVDEREMTTLSRGPTPGVDLETTVARGAEVLVLSAVL